MYNVQYYIQKLEDMTEYNFPFERVKQVKEQLTGQADGDKPKDEDDEPRIQEVIDTNEEKSTVITSDPKENKSVVDQLTQKGKTIDLSTVTEGDLGEAKEEDRKLL